MKHDAELKLKLPTFLLEDMKATKRTTPWTDWFGNDPRVKAYRAGKKEFQLAEDEIKRADHFKKESYPDPPKGIFVETLSWRQERQPLTWILLKQWFDQVATIPITRMVLREKAGGEEWVEDSVEEVPGADLAVWIKGQDKTFHPTNEGWLAKTNYGNPEVRLLFPWIATRNVAIPAAQAAELAAKALERKNRRRARKGVDTWKTVPKELFSAIIGKPQTPVAPVVSVAGSEILKDYKERLEILESRGLPAISWEEFEKEWHEIAASEAIVAPPAPTQTVFVPPWQLDGHIPTPTRVVDPKDPFKGMFDPEPYDGRFDNIDD